MNRTHALLLVVAGLLALLVLSPLYVRQLLAAPPAEPFMQAGVAGAVCPLSDQQEQASEQAFAPIAAVFTDQPRCVNCHGAVNPFAADAEKTHGGGKLEIIEKTVTTPNPSPGMPATTTTEDTEATFAQCQDCHSAFPGRWHLPPSNLFFIGKDAPTLCKQQKQRFGGNGADFVNHVANDADPNNPFVQEGFKGTRGLNDVGQSLATGPYPDPPKGVTHDQLIQMAKNWLKATGGGWKGGVECGCVPHHFALRLEEQTEVRSTQQGTAITLRTGGQVQVPITFKDDGSFTGSGQYTRIISETLESPDVVCSGLTTPQTVSWSLSGSVEDSNVDDAGVMHVKASLHTSGTTLNLTCRTPRASTSQSSSIAGGDGAAEISGILAVVGNSSSKSMPVPGLGGTMAVQLTIVQLD